MSKRIRHDGFNPIQIKDKKIVRLGKNGKIREVLDTWPPSGKKAAK
jgi:hypothetical protein